MVESSGGCSRLYGQRSGTMFKADDFRQYAQECIVSARESKSDVIREDFLNLAKSWIIAAAQIDGGEHTLPLDQIRH